MSDNATATKFLNRRYINSYITYIFTYGHFYKTNPIQLTAVKFHRMTRLEERQVITVAERSRLALLGEPSDCRGQNNRHNGDNRSQQEKDKCRGGVG
jgi:hypothetical protein